MKKTFIIAEAGVNHNGSMALAKELIDVAVAAGADAVKFQTFRTQDCISKTAAKAEYQKKATDESQYEMVKKLEITPADHRILIDYCHSKQISFMSTAFDLVSVDLLKQFDLSVFKIASGEITNAPLLLKIARTEKPVILSTGVSTLGDIEFALSVLAFGYLNNQKSSVSFSDLTEAYFSDAGQQIVKERVTLLHCTTEYPAPFSDVNLKALDTLRNAFGLSVGYSDHTIGIEVPIAAVARGATVIEKHFTVDKKLEGPDHQASLEPHELSAMVNAIRNIEQALGDGQKIPRPAELKNRDIVRKSLVAAQNIQAGEVFSESNIGIKRPGTGIPSKYYWELLGKVARRNYQEDEFIIME